MRISSNYNNQNFGMKLSASKNFWKSIKELEGKELKQCTKALKKIEKNKKIKDTYEIKPIHSKISQLFSNSTLGRIDTQGFKLVNSKGKEALSLTQKSGFFIDDAFFDYNLEETIKPNKFLEFISKKLKTIEKFEESENLAKEMKSQLSSTIKNIKA